MELRPFAREGRTLAWGAVLGYVMILGAWIALTKLGATHTVSGPYAQGFTFLVLPPLLMIPAGLTLIFGVLAARCEGFDNEVHVLRLGGLFCVVFSLAAGAALLAFYATETTVLYLQPHVLATALFCGALAIGVGHALRQVGVFDEESQRAGAAAIEALSLE